MPKKLACMPNSPQQGLQFGALSGLGMQTPLKMQVCPMSVATPDCGSSRTRNITKIQGVQARVPPYITLAQAPHTSPCI